MGRARLCFDPQERLFLTAAGRRASSPKPAPHRAIANNIAASTKRSTSSAPPANSPSRWSAARSPPRSIKFRWRTGWRSERFDSPSLRWYINYACRDDYGALAKDTSAWAGIHYFASREPEEKGPLTWPEGNGWIAAAIDRKAEAATSGPASVVYRVHARPPRPHRADRIHRRKSDLRRADVSRAIHHRRRAARATGFEYSPWLTANLTLDRIPDQKGAEPAWDNVIYDSPALGYVNATHMSLATHTERTVWTFYWSLAEYTPRDARTLLLAKDWNYWKEAILNDLSRAHPDIRQCVTHIDIMRMGHAMMRPSPGFMFSARAPALAEAAERNPLRQLRPERIFDFRRSPIPRRQRIGV